MTSDTFGELVSFAKRLDLDLGDLVNMRFHPHFRLSKDNFERAGILGAGILSKQAYDTFVSVNHF